ncbi:hypothetical protein [Stenomitos frigidus]|uniref:hypothetical protein n=1 Tax=Stenomitos frigidus TaxID=1886765 RepID=UPI0011B2197C|nr:hypothetical protein [Stenomitos frigidus]
MGFLLGLVMMARPGWSTGDGWDWFGGGDDPKRRGCQRQGRLRRLAAVQSRPSTAIEPPSPFMCASPYPSEQSLVYCGPGNRARRSPSTAQRRGKGYTLDIKSSC